jgi:hypothetical protein
LDEHVTGVISKTFMVGFAESLATPEVCFSLRADGTRVVSFFRQGGPKFARLEFVEYFPVTPPEQDFGGAVSDIQSLIDLINPDVIAPCDDTALLLKSRLDPEHGQSISTVATTSFAMDKWVQIQAAAACGLSIMKTSLVRDEGDIARFGCRPAFLKPRLALDLINGKVSKGKTFIIDDNRLTAEIRAAIAERPYLIQEYKSGVGEGNFGIAHRNKVYASFGHRRIRMMNPAGSGASACISRIPDDRERQAVEALVTSANWQGPFMVELLNDNRSGQKWFMEFNGRFWGSLALARRCGIDIPKIAFDLVEGKDAIESPPIKRAFARHLGRDLIHLLFVLRGRAPKAGLPDWPSRLQTIVDVLAPNELGSFYNYHPSQPLFFARDSALCVLNALFGRKI